MFPDCSLSEIVLFEIPGWECATGLCERLATNRLAWIETHDALPYVSVLLQPEEGDLAALLRTVQGWVAERGLVAVRFELDGRSYVLEAGQAIWASVPA